MSSLYESLDQYLRVHPEQLKAMGLSNNPANRKFVSNTLLQDPLSPMWLELTQQELVTLVLRQVIKLLRPNWTKEVDEVLDGTRMYPAGTSVLVASYKGIPELIQRLGIGTREEAPTGYATVTAPALDLELTRALISQGLAKLPLSIINQQQSLLRKPFRGYEVEKLQTGLALHVLTKGVEGLLPEVRNVVIREVAHAAIIQLLTDPVQQASVAEANGIGIAQPDEMYTALMSLQAPIIYPQGTYLLISSIPGIDKYIARYPEIGDRADLRFPNTKIQYRDIMAKTLDYIIQNYGLDPRTNQEIKKSLAKLTEGIAEPYLVRNLALILAQLHLSDPMTYYSLAYANQLDPLEAYNGKMALDQAWYPEGVSKALSSIIGREIKLKELELSVISDSPEIVRANQLFSSSQMITTLDELISPIGVPGVDNLNSDQMIVVFVVCLYLLKERRIKSNDPTYSQYIRLLYEK